MFILPQGHLYSNALVGLTGSHQPGLINNWIDNWRMSKDNEDPTGEKEVRAPCVHAVGAGCGAMRAFVIF